MYDDHEEQTEAILELPKTGLRIIQNELQRLGKQGEIIMRLPLDNIETVDFRREFDPFCLVFVLAGLGLAAIAYWVSENNILTCLLYGGAILVAGIGLLAMRASQIHLIANGRAIKIMCNDLNDEGQGFVMSLQQIVGNGHS